jgi:hypothetical protein
MIVREVMMLYWSLKLGIPFQTVDRLRNTKEKIVDYNEYEKDAHAKSR